MCLEIIVQISPDAKQRVSARRLSRETGLHVSKVTFENEPALHFSVSGGCSCEFLPQEYDPESPSWNLDPGHLQSLSRAVAILASEAGKFSFLVHFLGAERQRTHQTLGKAEFLRILETNQIGNNVLYQIE